jgi:outer membrane protein TolC
MKKMMFFLFLMLGFIAYGKDNTGDATNDQKSVTLKIDDAVSLALKNNLNIETENLKMDQKKWAMYTSWNVFVPNTTLSGAFTRLNTWEKKMKYTGALGPTVPSGSVGMAAYANQYEIDNPLPEWGVGLNFNMTFTLNAAMGFSVYQTILDWQSQKISLETAKKKLSKDVTKGFYQLMILKKSIKLTQDNLDMFQKRYDQASINYKNGLKSEYDMLSAQVSYENVKPQLMSIQNTYNIQMLNFKQMLGIKSDVNINFDGEIIIEPKDYDAKELIAKNGDTRLDIRALNFSLDSLKNLRAIKISALTPSFMLQYTMDPSFQKDPLKDNWFGDSTYNSDNWKQRSGMLMLAVSLPLSSLVPFSKEQMAIVNNEYTIKETQVGMKQLKQSMELEVNSLVMTLEKSLKSIDSITLNVKLAEKAFKIAEESYRAGSTDLLSLESAQLNLSSAKFNLLNEQYNYISSSLDLQYALEVGSTMGGATASTASSSSGGGAPGM